MGMFDYVKYEANCRKCGHPLADFQSKDGDCVMDTLDPGQVRHFYTSCDKCGTWHNFKVVPTAYAVVASMEKEWKAGTRT